MATDGQPDVIHMAQPTCYTKKGSTSETT